jgi:hypothetical protein
MAVPKFAGLFFTLIVLILLDNSIVLSIESGKKIVMTAKDLLQRQRMSFGDSLGYGYLNNNRLNKDKVDTKISRREV